MSNQNIAAQFDVDHYLIGKNYDWGVLLQFSIRYTLLRKMWSKIYIAKDDVLIISPFLSDFKKR